MAVIALIICMLVGLIIFQKTTHFVKRIDRWAIGIYAGDSPYNFRPPKNIRNPVLTAMDVTDVRAKFIADPFMIRDESRWYMFFEVMNQISKKGEIGYAISDDGMRWDYRQIVLREPFHLSYPYVFKWENDFYMIPESSLKKSIRLYKAARFPDKWEFAQDLLTCSDFNDSSVFYYSNTWWLFTCISTNCDLLKLFYAGDLKGPWFEHPSNPIVAQDAHIARPGGRVLVWGNRIIRYAQDDYPDYGNSVHAFEITKLTPTDYQEIKCPVNSILKASGRGWNKNGMHNIDPHFLAEDKWVACVDGIGEYLTFAIKKE